MDRKPSRRLRVWGLWWFKGFGVLGFRGLGFRGLEFRGLGVSRFRALQLIQSADLTELYSWNFGG